MGESNTSRGNVGSPKVEKARYTMQHGSREVHISKGKFQVTCSGTMGQGQQHTYLQHQHIGPWSTCACRHLLQRPLLQHTESHCPTLCSGVGWGARPPSRGLITLLTPKDYCSDLGISGAWVIPQQRFRA